MFNWFKVKGKSEESSPLNSPDFSRIDCYEKAVLLYDMGVLVKVHLMPLEFGGQISPVNTLYVPQFAQQFKQHFDGKMEKLLKKGTDLSYSAHTECKGNSFIPSKLVMKVKGDVDIVEVINVW